MPFLSVGLDQTILIIQTKSGHPLYLVILKQGMLIICKMKRDLTHLIGSTELNVSNLHMYYIIKTVIDSKYRKSRLC